MANGLAKKKRTLKLQVLSTKLRPMVAFQDKSKQINQINLEHSFSKYMLFSMENASLSSPAVYFLFIYESFFNILHVIFS